MGIVQDTPGRNYGCTVEANVERLRAAGLHESIPCTAADKFLATGKMPPPPRRTYAGRPKSSRFFGVDRVKRKGKFRGRICRKAHKWEGLFKTELEAHEAVERELERRANSKSSIENSQ
ncbi:MAG: hypothetical protein JRE40_09575 [Deltaproteobacteria bacterium]|nr:hypothetical protein [Deltaproteobacteria bacterium]